MVTIRTFIPHKKWLIPHVQEQKKTKQGTTFFFGISEQKIINKRMLHVEILTVLYDFKTFNLFVITRLLKITNETPNISVQNVLYLMFKKI